MKKYYFSAILLVSVSVVSAQSSNAEQNADLKYNKAKKEFRDAQAAKATQAVFRKQNTVEATPSQQISGGEAVKVETMKAKATKSRDLKATPNLPQVVKEQPKTN